MTMFQAQETHVHQMPDGTLLRVVKGEVFHHSHEAVKRDEGRGLLFKPLIEDDDKPKTTRPRASAAVKPKGESDG